MEHSYQGIFGWFNFEEVYSRMVAEAPDSAVFIEVGSWLGKSAVYLGVEIINSGKTIDLYCVDTWGGSLDDKDRALHSRALSELAAKGLTPCAEFLKNIRGLRSVITPVLSSSLDAAVCWQSGTVDFVFLDSQHTYEHVCDEIRAYTPLVKPGGYIGGHDYDGHYPGVVKAVNEIVGRDRIEVLGNSWLHKKPGPHKKPGSYKE